MDGFIEEGDVVTMRLDGPHQGLFFVTAQSMDRGGNGPFIVTSRLSGARRTEGRRPDGWFRAWDLIFVRQATAKDIAIAALT